MTTSKPTYAARTEVPIEKTQGEIRVLLRAEGCTDIAMVEREHDAAVAFRFEGHYLRMLVPLPRRDDKQFTHIKPYRLREKSMAQKLYDQACRSRWRLFLQHLKMRLQAYRAGIITLDDFLPYMLLPGGETVAERFMPNLAALEAGDEINPLSGLLPSPRSSRVNIQEDR